MMLWTQGASELVERRLAMASITVVDRSRIASTLS
jgi:hypothetical protein